MHEQKPDQLFSTIFYHFCIQNLKIVRKCNNDYIFLIIQKTITRWKEQGQKCYNCLEYVEEWTVQFEDLNRIEF